MPPFTLAMHPFGNHFFRKIQEYRAADKSRISGLKVSPLDTISIGVNDYYESLSIVHSPYSDSILYWACQSENKGVLKAPREACKDRFSSEKVTRRKSIPTYDHA